MKEIFNDSDFNITYLEKEDYENRTKYLNKSVKGKSQYEDYVIVELLPKNKEFYVMTNYNLQYENGFGEWAFEIITTYRNKYLLISCCGGI